MVIALSKLADEEEYECPNCGETFNSMFALMSHEEREHKEEGGRDLSCERILRIVRMAEEMGGYNPGKQEPTRWRENCKR